MTMIGYHASHEQFSPRELLHYVSQAELAGFQTAMSSDHSSPWSTRQGHSGFGWSWLGAALQATKNISFGSLAIPGGWRYHPLIVAQAAATLAEMFPQRFEWIAVGSGEAANEMMVGQGWPDKPERQARLQAAAEIIRALWRGETVTKVAGPILADHAKVWSLPAISPKIMGAALTPETANWMGSWADGLITVNQPPEKLRLLIDAFRAGGGENKPLFLQVHVSWAATDGEARANAHHQWRSNVLSPQECANLVTPEDFDLASEKVQPAQLDQHIHISADFDAHITWIKTYATMGFETIFLHNVGRNQTEFIEAFGRNVLARV